MNRENTSMQNAHILQNADSKRYATMTVRATEKSKNKLKQKPYALIYAERMRENELDR